MPGWLRHSEEARVVQAKQEGKGRGAEHIGSPGHCRVSGVSSECDGELRGVMNRAHSPSLGPLC